MKKVFALIVALIAAVMPGRAEIGDKIELEGIVYEMIEYSDCTPNPPYEYPIIKQLVCARVCDVNKIPENGVVTIPSTISIDGVTHHEVVQLKESLFEGRTELKEFNMTSSKCHISANAFKNCGDITLNISGVIKYVEDYAFSGTNVINGLDLSKAIIVGSNALSNTQTTRCTFGSWMWKLQSLVFTDSDIADISFVENECDYDAVLKFGTRTFYNCKLKEVRLPKRYMGIPWGMFNNCPNLERIIFPAAEKLRPLGSNYTIFTGMEGYPFYNEQSMIYNCPNLKEVVCLASEPIPFRYYSELEEICTDVTLLDDYSSCVLKVPAGSEDAYRADPVWGQFKYIKGFEPGEYTDIESVGTDAPSVLQTALKLTVGHNGLTQQLPEGNVEIYNPTGTKVLSAYHPGGTFRANLPQGIYILHVK